MCQDPITPDPCEARALTSDEGATFTTVSQPQRRLAGVAEPTESTSRLIADVGGGGGEGQDGKIEKVQES